MDISKLLPSRDLASQGKWLTFVPPTDPEESFEVLLAYGLRSLQEETEKRFAAKRRELEGRNLTPAERSEVTVRARVGTILLDWRGLESNGKPLPFSEDAAYNLMVSYPAFEFFILNEAGDVRHFQNKAADNSEPEGAAASQADLIKSGD